MCRARGTMRNAQSTLRGAVALVRGLGAGCWRLIACCGCLTLRYRRPGARCLCVGASSPRLTVSCLSLSGRCVQPTVRSATNARVVRRAVAHDRAGAVAVCASKFGVSGVEPAAHSAAFASGAWERDERSCADVALARNDDARPERTICAAGSQLRAPSLIVRDSSLKATAAACSANDARLGVRAHEPVWPAVAFYLHAPPMPFLAPSLPIDTPVPLLKGEKTGVCARAKPNSRRRR